MCNRSRSERGQFIVFFAVLVPMFIALMLFVVDVGKSYLENISAQNDADAIVRTVDAMLSTDDGRATLVSEIPSGATKYESYSKLTEAYSSAADTLGTMKSKVSKQAELCGVSIDGESFAVDETTKDLYYAITISKSYTRIMQVASADDGSGSSRATITRTMTLKFEGDKNAVTKINTPGGGTGSGSTWSDTSDFKDQWCNATEEENAALINALTNPSTAEEKAENIKIMNDLLGDKTDTSSDLKINIVKSLLESEALDSLEKGELFDSYLTSMLTNKQESGKYSTNLKTTRLNYDNNYTQSQIVDILYFTLQTIDTVSSLESPKKINNDEIAIIYKDNSTGFWNKVAVYESLNIQFYPKKTRAELN